MRRVPRANLRMLLARSREGLARVVAGRRPVEAALERRTAELDEAQAIAQIGSMRWTWGGEPEWSPELCRIFGLEPAEVPADLESFLTLVHPEDRAAVRAGLTAQREGQDGLRLEHRIVRPDGLVRHVEAQMRLVRDPSGAPIGVRGTCRDVTLDRAGQRLLEDSEARFRSLAENAPVAMFETDRDGHCTWVNATWERMTGTGRDQALGTGWRERIHPGDRAEVLAAWERAMLGQEAFDLPFRFLGPGGEEVHVIATAAALCDADDAVTGCIGTALDVTHAHRAERARREAEQRFRSAFDQAPIGMALLSTDLEVIEGNDALAELVGYGREQLHGLVLGALTHPEDAARDGERFSALLAGRADVHESEHRLVHATGETVWVALTATLVSDGDGVPCHYLAQLQDVTERRRYEEQLRYMANHDPLTGLLNRRAFERELDRHVNRVKRYGGAGAIVALDLDHFQTVNDTLGHNAGDRLLVEVAQRLGTRLRESDVIARLGGDEFAVLLPHASREEAERVAGQLLELVRRAEVPSVTSHRARGATASIGVVAVEPREGLTGEDLLVCADLAMYDAKEAGRNQAATYSAGPHERVRTEARMAWVERIRDALDGGDFVLHAQPIVDLASGAVSQYELLVRMVSESGDLIPPGSFLPVAERYDLIQELDAWVITRAIEMLADLQAGGRRTALEVNVSGRSLGDAGLMAAIEATLARTGADPAGLILEITETAAVANIPQAQAFGRRLSELGCRFALDDFGAGFGSFYYLKHLPFDILKIDGEFVRNCRANPVDRLVIESVVNIARGMGKQTVAEFVGDDDTVSLLRSYGVDFAQGFHLGKPAPLDTALGAAQPPQRKPVEDASTGSGLSGRPGAGAGAS